MGHTGGGDGGGRDGNGCHHRHPESSSKRPIGSGRALPAAVNDHRNGKFVGGSTTTSLLRFFPCVAFLCVFFFDALFVLHIKQQPQPHRSPPLRHPPPGLLPVISPTATQERLRPPRQQERQGGPPPPPRSRRGKFRGIVGGEDEGMNPNGAAVAVVPATETARISREGWAVRVAEAATAAGAGEEGNGRQQSRRTPLTALPAPLRVMEDYVRWHSVDALRREYEAGKNGGGGNENLTETWGGRSFGIGYYRCPHEAGNRLHSFWNRELLGVSLVAHALNSLH